VFTHRALREFFKLYEFEILKHEGIRVPAENRIVRFFDGVVSRSASLAFDQVLVARKSARKSRPGSAT
jgi:hypothetical protein